jgi:hypothetical protein
VSLLKTLKGESDQPVSSVNESVDAGEVVGDSSSSSSSSSSSLPLLLKELLSIVVRQRMQSIQSHEDGHYAEKLARQEKIMAMSAEKLRINRNDDKKDSGNSNLKMEKKGKAKKDKKRKNGMKNKHNINNNNGNNVNNINNVRKGISEWVKRKEENLKEDSIEGKNSSDLKRERKREKVDDEEEEEDDDGDGEEKEEGEKEAGREEKKENCSYDEEEDDILGEILSEDYFDIEEYLKKEKEGMEKGKERKRKKKKRVNKEVVSDKGNDGEHEKKILRKKKKEKGEKRFRREMGVGDEGNADNDKRDNKNKYVEEKIMGVYSTRRKRFKVDEKEFFLI